MKLNATLSLKQKLKIFFNLPGSESGALVLIFGLSITFAILSKIDTSPGKGGFIILLLFIFPVVGSWMLYENIRVFPRMIYALENGVCVEGKLEKIKASDTAIDGKPIGNVKLSYELYDQKYTITEKMNRPVGYLKTHLIMVDANDPNNAVYLETLPHDVKKELKRRNQYLQ